MHKIWPLLFLLCFAQYAFIACRKDKGLSQVGIPGRPGDIDTLPQNPGAPGQGELYSQVPVSLHINKNVGGYYEALPPNYADSPEKTFPLLIFLHGGGEKGDGSPEMLPLLTRNSVTKRVHEGTLPSRFTVNGVDYSFIIISPQFAEWPEDEDIDAVLEHAVRRYRVDTTRIYLSGLSMGGGATWEYAGSKYGTKLAAIVPICGASWADSAVAVQIAKNEVPAWAFHNNDDAVVTVNSTKRYARFINGHNPKYPVKLTYWESGGHDAWTQASDPEYREEEKNMYEWLLQFAR